jgi:hypothetical protein
MNELAGGTLGEYGCQGEFTGMENPSNRLKVCCHQASP